jgi:uncharacterized protein
MIRLFAAVWLATLAAVTPAAAQTFPPLTGRVVDNANLLDPGQKAALDAKLAAVEQRSGRQFVVATLPSLQGRTIEDYGYRLGRTWKIGSAEKDDGVLLIVAPNERKVRIETGYGARVFLTDAVSSVIIRNSILPRFKANDYPGGIAAGADQIIKTLDLPPAEAARRAKEIGAAEAQRRKSGGGSPFPIFIMVIVFFMVIGSIARRAGGKRYKRGRGGIDPMVILWGLDAISRSGRGGGGGWGGGGFGGGGGGGFSGGGGSFGGGGASGGW